MKSPFAKAAAQAKKQEEPQQPEVQAEEIVEQAPESPTIVVDEPETPVEIVEPVQAKPGSHVPKPKK